MYHPAPHHENEDEYRQTPSQDPTPRRCEYCGETLPVDDDGEQRPAPNVDYDGEDLDDIPLTGFDEEDLDDDDEDILDFDEEDDE